MSLAGEDLVERISGRRSVGALKSCVGDVTLNGVIALFSIGMDGRALIMLYFGRQDRVYLIVSESQGSPLSHVFGGRIIFVP